MKTDAIEAALCEMGTTSTTSRVDEMVAAALEEVANIRRASGRDAYARFSACCGGSDEHPPEHTQDCGLRTSAEGPPSP